MTLRTRLVCLLLAMGILLSSAAWCAGPKNVLVIVNDKSPISRIIGAYYVSKRKIPAKNVYHIKCDPAELTPTDTYKNQIQKPIKEYLAKTGLNKTVDYLVLTKGVPMRLPGGWSVDSALMCMDQPTSFEKLDVHAMNPYYSKSEHFSHRTYRFYLATRLDGYTVQDAKALVDRSLAAKPAKGLFLIDTTPGRNIKGYAPMNQRMADAYEKILWMGYDTIQEDTAAFAGGKKDLMGYFSWGSNDAAFDRAKYKSNTFRPGAIADTAVSSSARTMNRTDDGGQSLISDLIEAGVTGVKGYVAEPTLAAIADPLVLFDRYLSGYNLAESFYMASRFIFWREVVIGDPLCAPYATQTGKTGN